MSGSELIPHIICLRKPYKPPMLAKLSPKRAKVVLETILETKSIPGDEQAAKLLKEISRIKLENQ